MKFTVEGVMYIRKQAKGTSRDRSMRRVMIDCKPQPFVKEIEAISISRARELVLTRIGSDHHLGRSQIKINKVTEMKK